MAKKILFISLGCDKNRVDSERMLGVLSGRDYCVTDQESDADVVVVNTCCFIDEAKEESIQTILEMARLKETGSCKALIVAGCLSERYREEIFRELPEVDAIVGAHSYGHIAEAIEAACEGRRERWLDPPGALLKKEPSRVLTTGGFFAYLKIAEGCDRHCTYCVIPSVRGPYHSVPIEALLDEARKLAAGGVRELILVAQDTARYGTDLYGERRLHVLLEELCRIEELRWIRVLYVYPEELYPELIDAIAREKKICKYLDLPIQHSEDDILKRMGRRMTGERLREIVTGLRKKIPGIALRTTLISGFPGETEEEHQALLGFVREMRFDRLGVFAYSREEGTPAAGMPDQIPEQVRNARREELLLCQQEIAEETNQDLIGRTFEVFIEGFMPEEDVWVGRTYRDAPDVDSLFFIRCEQELHTGDLVHALATEAGTYDLIGELRDEDSDESAE